MLEAKRRASRIRPEIIKKYGTNSTVFSWEPVFSSRGRNPFFFYDWIMWKTRKNTVYIYKHTY